ncbi:MAG: polysaccharide deacetylase family protein [Clostridia bacterium]|nr:polysaccharide deacetylase family protein [Clostridia bacterium]
MNIDLNFFPGWVRKSISFSIDDGNVTCDRKFIEITKPHGIKGTFNLCIDRMHESPEFYREFYRGYEISNHCKYHPFALRDEVEYVYATEPFDKETADRSLAYRINDEGLTYIFDNYRGAWVGALSAEDYVRCALINTEALEEIFGEGSVRGFVWPFGTQSSRRTKEGLLANGFTELRNAGRSRDLDGFAIPRDKTEWNCNSRHNELLEVAKMYEEYADDGELKTFIFGVHSADFETDKVWHILETFSKEYGDRPDTYYYATVGEIFDYEKAIEAAVIADGKITNNSHLTLYFTVDGERRTLAPKSEMSL